MSFINDFISLVYPEICPGCGNPLWKNEHIICTYCDFHLPRTNFHLYRENQFTRIFWGRAKIECASAYLFFNKGSTVQHLVHALKYKGRRDLGVWLGAQFGTFLATSSYFQSVDCIIPVPLHSQKLIVRGFNQSEEFAAGLSKSMKIPVVTDILYRKRTSETQTRKSRFLRWQNVEEIFEVKEFRKLEGMHLMLVDDVVTTGATLESCISTLNRIPGVRISLAAIAIAAG